jgi:hypothetical protein
MIRVRAKQAGYYGHYREVGDEFAVEREEELGSWMQRLDRKGEAPARKGPPSPRARSNEELTRPTRADDPKVKDITRTVL